MRDKISVANQSSGVSGVAERYANALFELALEDNDLGATEASLDNFGALLEESADLERLVHSPVFSADDQVRALKAVLEKAGIGGVVANFICLSAANRRAFALGDMVRGFKLMAAAHRGEAMADVVSAQPLNEEQLNELRAAIKSVAGKDVNLNQSVDQSLIGGMIVKIGSRMMDTSVRTRLQSLRIAMKEVR